ncbi:MAG: PAS domain S-box protein [bacterium]
MTTIDPQGDQRDRRNDTMESLRLEVAALQQSLAQQAEHLADVEASEARLKTIVENTTVGILVAQDGMVMYANESLLEVSGHTREELGAFSFAEFVHPDDRGLVFERYVRRLPENAAPQQTSCEK